MKNNSIAIAIPFNEKSYKVSQKVGKITVRLNKEYIKLIEKYAKRSKRSITNTVEYAIDSFIKREQRIEKLFNAEEKEIYRKNLKQDKD